MAVTIKLRYLRHSAKKLRPYARIFKGKNLVAAIDSTSVMSQDSAKYLRKALLMAKASATAKEFEPEKMMISEIFATEGPPIKRMRPNAKGRSNKYQKHLSHLTVSLAEAEIKEKKVVKSRKTSPKAKKETNGTKN